MDDVKRLLEEFADRAVDGIPPPDVDAAVVRGRRALRRIRARRRVTGVLCAAVVTTAVLAIGNQAKWWGGGEAEVATGSNEAVTKTEADAAGTAMPVASPAKSDETMSLFAGAAIKLVSNRQTWSNIGCKLAPQGWTPQTPVAADRVVLTPPSARTSATDSKLLLQAGTQAQGLLSVRVTEADGKVFQVGTVAGRVAGQVKLGARWLVVHLPVGDKSWTDDLLRRFMGSCTVS